MNVEIIASELLHALRGRRSQVQLSRRLGYTSNVVYAWESGRKFPTTATFFRLLERTGNPVYDVLSDFFPKMPAALTDVDFSNNAAIALLLNTLIGDESARTLADRMGISRHTVGRWLRGEAQPRLPQLLHAIDATTNRLLDFIACMVDPAALPSLQQQWTRLQHSRSVLIDNPWVQTVLLATELSDYLATEHHEDLWMATRLNVREDEVHQAITQLSESSLLHYDGHHWTAGAAQTIDTPHDDDGVRQLKSFWLHQVRSRFDAEADGLYSHNVFAVAEADLATLRDLHIEYFNKVRDVVARSAEQERVVLLQLNLVPLDTGKTTLW